MIAKSDWQEWLDEERRRAGEPPTAEEMLAYSRGELAEEEAERIRAKLAAYPELARTLTEPFPDEEAEPGQPGYVSDVQLERRWREMQARIGARRTAPANGWRRASAALAAGLVLTLGGLLWEVESKSRVERRLSEPRVASDEQLLLPDGRRGSGEPPAVLTAAGDPVLLVVPLINASDYNDYRLELVDNGSNRTVWSSAPLRRRSNDTFSILVPRAFLGAGTYQVVLYGVSGAKSERLSTYSLRVPR